MQGLHLTADLHGCPTGTPLMIDTHALRMLCLAAVGAAGLQPVGELFHRFTPASTGGAAAGNADEAAGESAEARASAPIGITGVVLLAESHLAVHTWPELAAVTLDVYVCNFGADNSARAHALLGALVAAFQPAHVERHELRRGFSRGAG